MHTHKTENQTLTATVQKSHHPFLILDLHSRTHQTQPTSHPQPGLERRLVGPRGSRKQREGAAARETETRCGGGGEDTVGQGESQFTQ